MFALGRRISIAAALLGTVVLVSSGVAADKSPDGKAGAAAREFVAKHDAIVRPLEIALNLAWW
jgi:hypothetical protein